MTAVELYAAEIQSYWDGIEQRLRALGEDLAEIKGPGTGACNHAQRERQAKATDPARSSSLPSPRPPAE